MKIVDVEVIEFKHDWYKPPVPHKWGYGNPDNNNKGEVIESIIKIITLIKSKIFSGDHPKQG